MNNKTIIEVYDEIINYFGTCQKLADKIGVTKATVNNYKNRKKMTNKHAFLIEKLSNKKFKAKNLILTWAMDY